MDKERQKQTGTPVPAIVRWVLASVAVIVMSGLIASCGSSNLEKYNKNSLDAQQDLLNQPIQVVGQNMQDAQLTIVPDSVSVHNVAVGNISIAVEGDLYLIPPSDCTLTEKWKFKNSVRIGCADGQSWDITGLYAVYPQTPNGHGGQEIRIWDIDEIICVSTADNRCPPTTD